MKSFEIIRTLCNSSPNVFTLITGETVIGVMTGYSFESGTIVVIDVEGLPNTECNQGVHGIHIHAGASCTDVESHLDVHNCMHPYHTGDLPPLFSNDGKAWMAVYLDKFTPAMIVDKTIIIHDGVDDLKSQPSGNSGKMIACGVIRELFQ